MSQPTDLAEVTPGTLPAGTVTELGTIVRSTLTAYEMADGSFVAFKKEHGTPKPATPLVVFGSRTANRLDNLPKGTA
jgi:hypothetical protein